MNESRRSWSRRRLLAWCGAGTALSLAGCSGSDPDDQSENGDGDDHGNGDGTSDTHSELAANFELAGTGATTYRHWLHPEYQIDADLDVETKQLYQVNDFGLASAENVTELVESRQNLALELGIEPEDLQAEIILGTALSSDPNRVYLGSFDADAIGSHLQEYEFERTDDVGEYALFEQDITIAVGDDAIVTHPAYEALIEAAGGSTDRIEDVDEEVAILLDVLPDGIITTLARRDGYDSIVVDATVILGTNDEGRRNHEIRAFVFTDEAQVSMQTARDVISGGVFDESDIRREEAHDRVVMMDVER